LTQVKSPRLVFHTVLVMRLVPAMAVSLAVTIVTSGYIGPANGQILTPFRNESQAQRHCPGDAVVWLDLERGVYYLKGQRRYAQGVTGSFVCRGEASSSGHRRSLFGRR
jgi:hypothetical protein